MLTLTGLKPLYYSIKQNKYTYALFDFHKNGVEFHIFFDIEPSPFRLGFIAKGTNFDFWVDVLPGFKVDPFIPKFKELIKILNLKFDPNNKFSTISFFEEFNSKIPHEFKKPKPKDLLFIASSNLNIEEKNKIYYKTYATWKTRNRSKENSDKTRYLFPLIYERIKSRKNISISYTDIPNRQIDDINL